MSLLLKWISSDFLLIKSKKKKMLKGEISLSTGFIIQTQNNSYPRKRNENKNI